MKKIMLLISLVVFLFSENLNIKEIYLRSYNYEKMGDYEDAIKVLIPLYKKYPNGYTINLRLAYLFYLNKKYKNAINHYQIASKILPYSFEPKLGMMRVYLTTKDYKRCIEIGNVILKTDFYNYYGNYYYALSLIKIKDYKNALVLVNKILSLYPTDTLFLVELGKIYYFQGKKELSKKIFEDVLILDPNNVIAKEYLKSSYWYNF